MFKRMLSALTSVIKAKIAAEYLSQDEEVLEIHCAM